MNSKEIVEKKDTLDVLVEKHPAVFKNFNESDFWISGLPSGWFNLMDNLCTELGKLLEEERSISLEKESEPLFSVLQIKEKFGGLRFYYTMNTDNKEFADRVRNLIDIAEDTSYSVCEITGKSGMICRNGPLYHTFCEEVRINHGYELIGQKKPY